MTQNTAPRTRKVRVLATLGPASNTPEMIRKLYLAGADAFRINMSHGAHEDHAKVIESIRLLEKELGRPMTVLVDLQGPKLRVGRFEDGSVMLEEATKKAEQPFALIFGNEGSGLPAEFAQMGQAVRIPHNDKIDSLNLSIAVGIGAYAFVHAKD